MIALFRFAFSPLDDPAISFDEFAAFASDQVQRMSGNNPDGALSELIALTMPVLDDFHDALDSDQTKLGIRKGAKLVKNRFRREIVKEVGRLEAAVVARYGMGTPEVLQVVPQGRGVFQQSRDDRIQDHLEALVTGITALEPELGPAVTADAIALRDQWLAVYAASEESTGVKQKMETDKQAAKDALSWRLYENLIAIAKMFPRDPDKIRLYFQQSLLGIPEPKGKKQGSGGDTETSGEGGTSGEGDGETGNSSDGSDSNLGGA